MAHDENDIYLRCCLNLFEHIDVFFFKALHRVQHTSDPQVMGLAYSDIATIVGSQMEFVASPTLGCFVSRSVVKLDKYCGETGSNTAGGGGCGRGLPQTRSKDNFC